MQDGAEAQGYSRLDAARIEETLTRLVKRIEDRFPGRGLGRVCAEILRICRVSRARVEALRRPYHGLRLLAVALMLISVLAPGWLLGLFRFQPLSATPIDAIQGLEALFNAVFLIAAGILFVATGEERMKRRRTLAFLHELRSLAHVVDMHQLTKDPSKLSRGAGAGVQAGEEVSRYDLARYLEYCSEMLSLIGKLSALYAQDIADSVVIEAVNDLENLTTNLSRKIWQKIILLRELEEDGVHHQAFRTSG